jgi:hypothetical protein
MPLWDYIFDMSRLKTITLLPWCVPSDPERWNALANACGTTLVWRKPRGFEALARLLVRQHTGSLANLVARTKAREPERPIQRPLAWQIRKLGRQDTKGT